MMEVQPSRQGEPPQPPPGFLERIHETSWGAVLFVLGAAAMVSLLALTMPGSLPAAFTWGVVIFIGILALARMRPSDLGFGLSAMLPALVYTLVVWGLLQASVIIAGLVGKVQPAPTGESLGPLVEQLFFFALAGEIIFRGFFFPQLWHKFRRAIGSHRAALAAALLVSQALFALLSIPQHLGTGHLLIALLADMLSGLLYCYLYWRSENLFFAVGVHALGNTPTLLFGSGGLPALMIGFTTAFTAVMVLEVWLRLYRKNPEADIV